MFVLYCVCTSSLGWRFLPAAVHCRSSSVNKLWVSWFGRHLFLWSMWTLRKMRLLSACSLCAVSNCNPSDCTANCMTAVEFFFVLKSYSAHVRSSWTSWNTAEIDSFKNTRVSRCIFVLPFWAKNFFSRMWLPSLSHAPFFKKKCVELVGVLAKLLTFPVYIRLNEINRYCKGTQ